MGEYIDKWINVFDRYDSRRKWEVHTNVNSGLIKISLVFLVLHFPSVYTGWSEKRLQKCSCLRFVCPFFHLFTHPHVHLLFHLPVHPSVQLYFFSVRLSFSTPKYRMFHQPFHLPLQLSIHPASEAFPCLLTNSTPNSAGVGRTIMVAYWKWIYWLAWHRIGARELAWILSLHFNRSGQVCVLPLRMFIEFVSNFLLCCELRHCLTRKYNVIILRSWTLSTSRGPRNQRSQVQSLNINAA